jgi:hypothetical protein
MADKVRAVLVGGAFRHDAGQLFGWGGRGVHQPKTITATVNNSCCKQQHTFLTAFMYINNRNYHGKELSLTYSYFKWKLQVELR